MKLALLSDIHANLRALHACLAHAQEAGATWLARIASIYPHLAWINPEPEHRWAHTRSIAMIRELLGDRMYPLTLAGIDRAARSLTR